MFEVIKNEHRQVGDVKAMATVGQTSISVGVVCTSVTKASFGGNENQIALVTIRTVRWRAAPDIGHMGILNNLGASEVRVPSVGLLPTGKVLHFVGFLQ